MSFIFSYLITGEVSNCFSHALGLYLGDIIKRGGGCPFCARTRTCVDTHTNALCAIFPLSSPHPNGTADNCDGSKTFVLIKRHTKRSEEVRAMICEGLTLS